MTRDRGWLVHRYDSVRSTMDIAAQLARFGAPDRTAVISAEQRSGRGRSGRPWLAPSGASLFCTLILRPCVAPDRLSTLPLVTGVAVAEAIEQVTMSSVQVKWPNDIWIGADPERRKTAGILTTSHVQTGRVDYVLVGIGINVTSQQEELPPGATSLLAATGVETTPDAVFNIVLDRFDFAYEAFTVSDGRQSLDEWLNRAALLGEYVTIEDAGREVSGVFIGIDQDGALLLRESDSNVRTIVAGDLTRGPVAAP